MFIWLVLNAYIQDMKNKLSWIKDHRVVFIWRERNRVADRIAKEVFPLRITPLDYILWCQVG